MDGKAIQVELYDNVLEAVGIVRFEYENTQYLLYSLNEEIDSNGEKLDKIYVSEDAAVPQRIPDAVYGKIKEIITAMGETVDLNLNDFKMLLIDKDKYKVAEPRKLGTHKYMCKEILRKYKKLEEETKMNQENQAQAAPMFVDPSMMAPEQPVAEQVAQPTEPTQNAFNMAPPAADQVTPVQPTAEQQPAVTPVAEVQPAPAVAPVAETPVPVAPVAQEAAPVEPTYISTAVPTPAPVEPAMISTPTEPIAPVVETPVAVEPVAPVAEVQPVQTVTNDINPEAKAALDTLYRVYNNDKTAIINAVNSYTPQINTVETNNIDLNNIPVVAQADQTESLGEERVFTGNTGPIPVVTPEMVSTPVAEVQPVTPVQTVAVEPVTPVAEVAPVTPVEPVAAETTMVTPTDVQPVTPVENTMVTPIEVQPVAPVQDAAPVIQPLNPVDTPNIDISSINNDQQEADLGIKLPDTPVQMPEGQANKVVGFGLMDGQPNNEQNVQLAA